MQTARQSAARAHEPELNVKHFSFFILFSPPGRAQPMQRALAGAATFLLA
jgi:hypothetical protein